MIAINDFLKEIKKRRVEAGMSMELTGSIVGCGKGYICEIEHHKYNPNFAIALKLALLFDISIDKINKDSAESDCLNIIETFECPKCSAMHSLESNPVRLSEFAKSEIKCAECGAEFIVTAYADGWSFTTEMKDEGDNNDQQN